MMSLQASLFVALALTFAFIEGKRRIHVGAIFQVGNEQAELAFKYAINRFNMFSMNYTLEPFIDTVSENDSYKAGQIVCDMAEHGILAIFGPDSPKTNNIIQSISEALEIPQFQTYWNPRLAPLSLYQQVPEKTSQIFNLFPEPNLLARALATLLKELRWKTFAIIYQDDDGLIRLQDILKSRKSDDLPITIKKLQEGPDYRPILKEIKKSEEYHIILDCDVDNVVNILEQADELKLLEDYHSWLITSLDTHTLDFGKLKGTSANITSVRLLDPYSRHIRNAVRDWEYGEKHQQRTIQVQPESVRTQTALLYDAMNFFLTIYTELDVTERMPPKVLSCDETETSDHGFRFAIHGKLRLLNKSNLLPGPISGPIVFDDFGRRKNFTLQIIELSKGNGFRKTATWNSTFPLLLNLTFSPEEKIEQQFQGKVFRVVSRLGPPYLMEKSSELGHTLKDNDRYEGYSLDIIDEISQLLNFTYRFEIVPDNNYGSYDPETKEWNGLIRHILDRKADLAICDLTITYERRKAVDFTMPFMRLGISILYSKAKKPPPELFSFMQPLSLDIWLYMATAYLGMSVVIFVVARITPRDWQNPHPCNPKPETLENIWNIKNCFWLTLGSIMAQGCDILPKGIATRTITGMWWFFSLIMTASYTANLAAFLTMDRMGETIESAEDLAKQTAIKYGAVHGGATLSFFQHSNLSLYQRMWTQMQKFEPTVFEKSNADGVKRVLASKQRLYAFLMESSSLEYEMERNCDLEQVGSWLDTKGYGIAMPFQSQYRTAISGAVLKMQEEGTLHKLKKRWWKEKYGGGKCESSSDSETEADAAKLKLANVGGVFVVLIAGVIIAFMIAVLEFLWNVRKIAVSEHMKFREALKMEMRFVLDIWAKEKAAKLAAPDVTSEEFVEDNNAKENLRRISNPFMHINVLKP